MTGSWLLLQGDARVALRAVPDGCVHCVVTSPPYWGLRDYGLAPSVWGGDRSCGHDWQERVVAAANGSVTRPMSGPTLSACSATRRPRLTQVCRRCDAWRGQLGLEPTPDLYVAHLLEVLAEVHRVLRADGTLWLNLGDSYVGSWGNYIAPGSQARRASNQPLKRRYGTFCPPQSDRGAGYGLKPKDLAGVPWRVAFALQEEGWWLRSDVIWHKPNGMPESVRDRPTRSHEYLFLLAKSRRYRYNAAAIVEACRSGPSDIRKMLEGRGRIAGKHKTLVDPFAAASRATNIGRKRAVGSPWGRNRRSVWTVATQPYRGVHFATFPTRLVEPCVLAGSPPGGLVLDPFAGAGTALLVAVQLGRHAIGVEANPRYCRLARRRIEAAVGPSAVSRASQALEAALA